MELDQVWSFISDFSEELPWDNLRPVIILAVIVIVGIAVFRKISRKPDFDSADPLKRQAHKREGLVKEADGERRLEFSYRNMPIVFLLKKAPVPGQTVITIDMGAFLNLLLSINSDLKTGSPDIKRFVTENIKFDDELIVETNNHDFAVKLLTRDIQQILLEFKRANESFSLSIKDAFMNLNVSACMEKEAEIDRFITMALLLCDRLKFAQKSILD